ncbi:protein of unknown function [Ralstonia solanacearum PSI07]|nr:protein of unknown function [Ralstonia solanacearum PSI07]
MRQARPAASASSREAKVSLGPLVKCTRLGATVNTSRVQAPIDHRCASSAPRRSLGLQFRLDTTTTTPATTSLASRRATNSHQVSVTGYFACQSQLEPPFLTMDNEGKVTLVLMPRRHFLEFASTCECSRSMTIDISGRLTAGQTLYVLNDREVVGHVVVP